MAAVKKTKTFRMKTPPTKASVKRRFHEPSKSLYMTRGSTIDSIRAKLSTMKKAGYDVAVSSSMHMCFDYTPNPKDDSTIDRLYKKKRAEYFRWYAANKINIIENDIKKQFKSIEALHKKNLKIKKDIDALKLEERKVHAAYEKKLEEFKKL